ncbi:MAG: cell division protein ZapE [Gammaproteobacteria bacterium]|jgi:cell division protein ZapE|nr:cell division protein ZapE [Gammaproteobacteria bacterium]
MDTPLSRYQADQARAEFSADAAQMEAIGHLQRLFDELQSPSAKASSLKRLFGRSSNSTPKGLYFWGGVGRGKTYLMDIFFECLPNKHKQRTHFHRFMRDVHRRLEGYQGERNPLQKVAADLAAKAKIICFDEFFVTDITDAMILGGLIEALMAHQVILVATSNIEPARLYENGLQRQRFMPAIALLQQHTVIVNVDGGTDYRLRNLQQAELYHCPLDADADISLEKSFCALAPVTDECQIDGYMEINRRLFHFRKQCEDVIWFDFAELCNKPRSQNDYLEIACEYHALLLSNVPQMSRHTDDQARRFVNLVDVCYDANVKLIISAAVDLLDLYAGGGLDFVFQRTLSRLQEMQSVEYLAKGHIA